MIRLVLLLSSICGLVRSSGVHHGNGLAHLAPVAVGPVPAPGAPVVTAASSQYFQRTFNRLVVPQVVAPVAPVAPPPLQPVFPVAAAPPVFVEPTRAVHVAINPPPTQEVPVQPVQPNVAIAVATAHAAAPVATILLPPYPFGFPPNIGFIPPEQPINVPDENNKEPTTQSTTQAEATTTQEPEQTTPIPSSSDDNFVQQALPSNEDVATNFNQYGPPLPPPDQQFPPQFQPQQPRPQFQPQQPQGQFPPQQPQGQFPPHQSQGQFPPQQPHGQFPPQQPQGQFSLQQSHPQFPPQQSQFPQQRPQGQFPPQQHQQQFPQQPRPLYQPAQQPQQPRPQFQPQAQPQQPRPVYQAPKQPWPQHKTRPQKLKTSVEVVPVPLAYITPPPLPKTHAHVKVIKHIYAYVPASNAKIILKPVKIRPVRVVKVKKVHSQNLRANARDIEVTTFSPFPRPNTKPPRV